MDLRTHKILIAAVSVLLGSISAILSYLLANAITPRTAVYHSYAATSSSVRVGGTLRITATYEKRYDCGGVMIITLDDASLEGPRVIYSQALGDRPPGLWSVSRVLRIPADAQPGSAIIQESLAYSCGWKSATIRSPSLYVTLVEDK